MLFELLASDSFYAALSLCPFVVVLQENLVNDLVLSLKEFVSFDKFYFLKMNRNNRSRYDFECSSSSMSH